MLRELVPLLLAEGNLSKATTLYRGAFDYARQVDPHPEHDPDQVRLGVTDLASLAYLYELEKNYSEAINVLRTGARWLQGRIKEASWDLLADDREFDPTRQTREDHQKEPRAQREARIHELDPTLRPRLGVARLYQGKKSEARVSRCNF